MEKIIIKKENLNLKGDRGSISGVNDVLGGFFIVDRRSRNPSSDYVEVHVIREIIDKRNKRVKIVSLKEHNHSIAVSLDKYYRSEYCLICTECSYRKKHSFEFVYQIKDKYKHTVRKKCTNCGYEEEVEEYHEFKVTKEENRIIKRCKCGYEEVEIIQLYERDEIENFKRVITELKEKKNLLKADIQELENQEKKVKEEIENLKSMLRLTLPSDLRFHVRRYSEEVQINEIIISDSEKLKGTYHRKSCSFLWRSEVEIYSQNTAEVITELEKDEIPQNVVEYIREQLKKKEGVIQLLKKRVEQLEGIRVKLKELYNENNKLYDEINQIEKLLEDQI